MPRRRPDGIDKGVVEHRITLGNYERAQFQEYVKAQVLVDRVNAGAQVGKSVLIGGAAVGASYALYESYLLAREWLSSSPVLDAVNLNIQRLTEAGLDPNKPSPVPVRWRVVYQAGSKLFERLVVGTKDFDDRPQY